MTLEELKQLIPDYAKDIRMNLGSLLSEEGSQGLKVSQIYGVALSTAYALRNKTLIEAIKAEAATQLTDKQLTATRSAAAVMAMNNIYYRTLHLAHDAELSKLPARLRMSVIAQHGIEKVDFELYALAVSALAGCESCIKSHVHEVRKAGVDSVGVQSTFRIASVLNAVVQVIETIE